jgi:hypothetical protein
MKGGEDEERQAERLKRGAADQCARVPVEEPKQRRAVVVRGVARDRLVPEGSRREQNRRCDRGKAGEPPAAALLGDLVS